MFRTFRIIVVFSILFIVSCNKGEKHTDLTNTELNSKSVTNIDDLSAQIRKNPLDADLFVKRAKVYFSEGLVDEAIDDMSIAVKIDSIDVKKLLLFADFRLKQGKSGKAKALLEKCIEIDSKNIEAYYKLANLYFYVKNYKKAMEILNKIGKIDHNYPQLFFTKGMIYKETGDTEMAINNFQIAIEKEPEYYDAYIMLGILFSERGDSLALDYYKNAINIIPKSLEAHYNLAMFYQENNREKEALNEYNTILNEIDSLQPNIYFNIAYVNMKYINNYKESIEQYTKAIELNPNYLEAYYNRGFCYEQLSNYVLAKKDYKKALKLKDNFALAIKGLNRLDKLSVH